MVRIVADSSCDCIKGFGEGFRNVPMLIYTADTRFQDDENLDVHQMLDQLAQHKGRIYTACPGTGDWLTAFEGADEIYVVTLTSGLSGTYGSALSARNIYLEENPNAKIAVFDTLSTGPEMYMVLEKLEELVDQKISFDKICEIITAYIKQVHLFFVLGSLHNLAQNGRVSKVIAGTAGMVGLNLLGFANDEGIIEKLGVARGGKRIIASVIEELKKFECNGKKIRISHVENEELAQKLSQSIQEVFKNVDIKIYPARGLCSYYAERGGLLIGFES